MSNRDDTNESGRDGDEESTAETNAAKPTEADVAATTGDNTTSSPNTADHAADTADELPVGAVTDDGQIVTAKRDESNDGIIGLSSSRGKLWSVAVAVGLGFGTVVMSLIVIIGLISVLQVLSVPLPESALALITLELVLGQLVIMGGIAIGYLWATGRRLSYVTIRWPSLKEWLVVLAGPFAVFAVSIVVNLFGMVLEIESSPHAIAEIDAIDPTFYLYLIPIMIFIVGPFEELLYRGVIQTRLRESFSAPAAIGIASVVFALIHLPAYGLGAAGAAEISLALTVIFGGSLVFGGLYEWTGNLTVVALVHGLYNSIALFLLYVVTVYEEEIMEVAETAVVLAGL